MWGNCIVCGYPGQRSRLGLCPSCEHSAQVNGPIWDAPVGREAGPEYDHKPNKRAAILDTAKGYVTKDRQATHGEPEDSFGMIARLWSAYLGQEIKSHDVCSMMALLKVARAKSNPANDENWIDMAGYAACGAEVAIVQRGIEVEEGK